MNQSLKIVHMESSRNMGGQEIDTLQTMHWLLSRGHKTWLLACEDSAILRAAREQNLPCRAVEFRGSLNPIAIAKSLKFCRDNKVSLIHCHSSRDAAVAIWAKLLGIPVVRSLQICKPIKDTFLHRLVWHVGNSQIIAVSNSIRSRIIKQKLAPAEKINIVPSGINLNIFHPNILGNDVRAQWKIPADAKVITKIGMIRPDKGQKYLLQAVDQIIATIPNAYFLIVGSATRDEYQHALLNELSQVKNRERVIFTGFQQDVEKYIAASDVIVITSIYEAQSLVIPQALAMKRIVVASHVGGIPEMITHRKNGFLYECGDITQLAYMVVTSLTEYVDDQIETGYQFAQQTLGIDHTMQKILEVYRKALR